MLVHRVEALGHPNAEGGAPGKRVLPLAGDQVCEPNERGGCRGIHEIVLILVIAPVDGCFGSGRPHLLVLELQTVERTAPAEVAQGREGSVALEAFIQGDVADHVGLGALRYGATGREIATPARRQLSLHCDGLRTDDEVSELTDPEVGPLAVAGGLADADDEIGVHGGMPAEQLDRGAGFDGRRKREFKADGLLQPRVPRRDAEAAQRLAGRERLGLLCSESRRNRDLEDDRAFDGTGRDRHRESAGANNCRSRTDRGGHLRCREVKPD